MLRLLVFFVFLFASSFFVFGQKVDVGYFVNAWSVSDKTQTEKAEVTYKILTSQFNPSKLENAVKELKAYISKNPSKRLKIRLRMFEVLGKREF